MTLRIYAAVLACLVLQVRAALPPEYGQLKADAEKLYAERSFSLAHEAYKKTGGMDLPPEEKRWVDFRLADTQWRAQAATQTADATRLDQARQQLEFMVRDLTRPDQHDRIWAEVEESLADFHWTRRNNNNWGAAWPYYQQALDWWAGSAELDLARQRYLALVWRTARPPEVQPYYTYGAWGNYLPLDIIENTLKISQTENDKAHAHYLLAMTLRNQGGDWDQRARVPEEFDAALKSGKKTEWYDDALYNYGEWMAGQGRAVQSADGSWRQEPDYPKALELFRRLVAEFQKGETRYWENAQNQIRNITGVQLGVSVPNVFLPDSEIQYFLNWRNLKRIDLALYPVELNRDVKLRDHTHWHHAIDTSVLEKLKSWSKETQDKGDYAPGSATMRLDAKLKPGAYVLEVRGGGNSARELILVTDATLVLKSSGRQALAWFCNALDGEPLGGARIKLQERWHENDQTHVHESEANADKDGLVRFDLVQNAKHPGVELFASAILKDRQAFCTGVSYGYNRPDETWKIYAFTDRPAYRPKETAQWKFIARQYNGSVYSTPVDQTIEFQIDDPRGAKVKADKIKLNAFGSAWGALELTEQMPLGEYRVTFWDNGRSHPIGYATLFRLEEYKLPEFKVTVETPEEQGRKKAFRLGEKVEVNVQADYYFGGPVANASVEVVVYQNPFYHYWHQPREFPWFYEDIDAGASRWNRWYGGQGQIIKRETLKTDAAGKASLTFETPRGQNQDLQYRIEARVTDSSRREIIGTGNVRVTRQRYYVCANAEHNLYRPQDKVEVDFKALDANEQPVQTEGVVKVTRDYWYEIWIDPDGKEVKGEDLKRVRGLHPVFPPSPQPGRPGWTLKFRGYEHDEILTRTLKTDTNGVAELTFTPDREGYYRVAWSSEDRLANAERKPGPVTPITAETTVWVATGATTELGYRHGGLQIIADKDTFRVGQKAPVMLVVPTNDRYVLFTVEGEELYSYQLVHVDGTVKLIELAIEEKHVPNIFLGAILASDRQVFQDSKQVVVPPTKNFLTVDIKPDRAQYEPREEGSFIVTTRDDNGRPVPAEVAFGLVDESVYYIQHDYAGDPRQFYFGTKRPQLVQTQSTMNQKSYAKLVRGEGDNLMDELEVRRRQMAEGAENAPASYMKEYSFADRLSKVKQAASADGSMVSRRLAARAEAPVGLGGAAYGGAPAASPMLADKEVLGADLALRPAEPGQEPAVQVRSDFRSTVLWQPDLVTDQNGSASIKVKYPDSLTAWKATARVVTRVNQFGTATTGTRTKQPLIVRLQAPRFFLVGDTVTLSAVVNNNTDQPMQVRTSLDLPDPASAKSLAFQDGKPQTVTLNVPAGGEARADWVAEVRAPGEVKLNVTGRGGKYADAMEKSYQVYEHGIEKFIARSGKARGNDITIKLDLPKERKPGSTSLTVQVTPSMAVTMLDALPYLIDYPYGCTEQTMSRFLPAVIAAKTLKDLGLQPEDIMSRVFGGIEQTNAAATHPRGKKELAELDKI
ncbi:MAG TPA: alpha-2-macroglobulin family protein, partial [Verrucomicrobiae bacterium]